MPSKLIVIFVLLKLVLPVEHNMSHRNKLSEKQVANELVDKLLRSSF